MDKPIIDGILVCIAAGKVYGYCLQGEFFDAHTIKEVMSMTLMLMMMNSIWDRDVNKMKDYSLRCSYRLADRQWLMIFVTLLLELVILIMYCELSS